MKQIVLALHSYHEKWGAFPAACTLDSKGTRLHSWRTLILPYIELKFFYDGIDLSQPWDSVANTAAAASEIPTFHSPADSTIAPNETSYVAVTGPGFLFDGINNARFSE